MSPCLLCEMSSIFYIFSCLVFSNPVVLDSVYPSRSKFCSIGAAIPLFTQSKLSWPPLLPAFHAESHWQCVCVRESQLFHSQANSEDTVEPTCLSKIDYPDRLSYQSHVSNHSMVLPLSCQNRLEYLSVDDVFVVG